MPGLAGYDSAEDTPDGDWQCWFCAKQGGIDYAPQLPVRHRAGGVRCISAAASCVVMGCLPHAHMPCSRGPQDRPTYKFIGLFRSSLALQICKADHHIVSLLMHSL